MKIRQFYKALERRRKPPSDDPYDRRLTHCYLHITENGKVHVFEVRGFYWKAKPTGCVAVVHAVNWTLAAGYCIIDVSKHNIKNIVISDTYKLFGNS
jgi:hypothetical protein